MSRGGTLLLGGSAFDVEDLVAGRKRGTADRPSGGGVPTGQAGAERPLRLSGALSLPLDAVTETFAIIGKRGAGKTATAVVLVEEFIAAGQPCVVVDPLGVWWGLRSSADGAGPGLPVVIFGGARADVPLTERAGGLVAEALVASRAPAVLDLSEFSKSAMRRFMADFVEALYRANRDPMHVVFDEADLFAPQRTSPEGNRLLGAMEDLQRRGRARGLGTTLITQRPAVLHKDLLSQAECLVALRLTGPRDVAAVDEWVRLNADDDEAREVKSSLASLPVGTAWVWSPSWLGLLEKVPVRPRETFDSSATPRPGVVRPTATRFAAIDKAALGEQIAALEAAREAVDPAALRREVESLRVALAKASAGRGPSPVEVPVEVRVEVPVLGAGEAQALAEAADRILRGVDAAVEEAQARLAESVEEVRQWAGKVSAELAILRPSPAASLRGRAAAGEAGADSVHRRPHSPSSRTSRGRDGGPAGSAAVAAGPAAAAAGAGATADGLSKAQRLILTAAAQYGDRRVEEVAILTGYRVSGNFRNALSGLRTSGLIAADQRGLVAITDRGRAVLGPVAALPTGDALLEEWKANTKAVPAAARAVLDVLRDAYPAAVGVEDLAAATGYQVSGNFRNALSRLRTLGLATGRGELVLSADLVGD